LRPRWKKKRGGEAVAPSGFKGLPKKKNDLGRSGPSGEDKKKWGGGLLDPPNLGGGNGQT